MSFGDISIKLPSVPFGRAMIFIFWCGVDASLNLREKCLNAWLIAICCRRRGAHFQRPTSREVGYWASHQFLPCIVAVPVKKATMVFNVQSLKAPDLPLADSSTAPGIGVHVTNFKLRRWYCLPLLFFGAMPLHVCISPRLGFNWPARTYPICERCCRTARRSLGSDGIA